MDKETVSDISLEMADIFDEHHIIDEEGVTYLTPVGMQELLSIFEEIPTNDRANVFGNFLLELKDRGYSYDVEQFQKAQ